MQLRDALPSYAKHIGHFALNPNSVATRVRSPAIMHAIARCTSLIRQTHWPIYLNYPNAVETRVRSQAIMQLRDALLSYAKHIGNC